MNGSSLRVAFRADASIQIGTGHIMRCLTLADALRAHGAECLFICRPHEGNLMHQIAERGHCSVSLPAAPSGSLSGSPDDPAHAEWLGTDWLQDAEDTRRALVGQTTDWLVVDHYAIDRRWGSVMRGTCKRLLVMDDLADRQHDCDLLLDPSLGRNPADYDDLVPAEATKLLGPRHALLRPEFSQLRAKSLARRAAPELRHLLITMGGVDKDNVTGSVLDALDACYLPGDLRITVVMGPHSPGRPLVQARAAEMRLQTQVRVGVNNMGQLMASSDLAIGAGGGTSWERCCLGLPAIVLALAENQIAMASTLQEAGAIVATTSADQAAECLQGQLSAGTIADFLAELSLGAASVTDGQGVARVVQSMKQLA